MAAQFRIDQATPGAGVLDRTRHDLVPDEIISLVVPSPVPGAVYTWEITDKVGSVAELSASTGTSVTIGPAGDIVALSGFSIQLTEQIGNTITRRRRLATVPGAVSGLRPFLFAESADKSATLADNDPSKSTDNALYADRAGLGVASQNYRGWAEGLYQMQLTIEALTGGSGVSLSGATPQAADASAGSAGASTTVSRGDHKHQVSTAAPGAIAIGDTASAGSASSLARSDHRHSLAAPAAPADVTKATASAGAASEAARADHKHDVSTAAAGAIAIGDSAAEGTASSLARSDHKHSLAAPAAPANVTKAAASAGTASEAARADHKHDITTAAPSSIGTANSEGSASSLARSDHVHNHGVQTDTTLHALATASLHGFMSSTYAAKLDGLANEVSYVTVSGTSKTLGLSDAHTTQECTSGSATTITVPNSSSVAYTVGTVICIAQVGAGQVTLAPAAGVTLQSGGSELKTSRQHAEVFIQYRGSNVWRVSGEKTA